MEPTPKVSIVIPVYNGSNYLSEAIDSALAQTYENIEIVVVNDGSADGGKTEEIALSYGDKIRYFHKENGGVGSALNLGIEKANGEYISWLSHDDVYLPHKIKYQVEQLKDEPAGAIAYGDFEIIDSESRRIGVWRAPHVEPEKFIYALLAYSPVHGCTVLAPKRSFEAVGKFNEALATTQDYEMWFRLARQFKFIHMPEILIRSRAHSEQHSKVESRVSERNNLYKWALDEFSADEIFAGGGKSVYSSYLELAVNLKGEHKRGASKYARDLARKHFRKTSFNDYAAYGLFFYRRLAELGFRTALKALRRTAFGNTLVDETKARLQTK